MKKFLLALTTMTFIFLASCTGALDTNAGTNAGTNAKNDNGTGSSTDILFDGVRMVNRGGIYKEVNADINHVWKTIDFSINHHDPDTDWMIYVNGIDNEKVTAISLGDIQGSIGPITTLFGEPDKVDISAQMNSKLTLFLGTEEVVYTFTITRQEVVPDFVMLKAKETADYSSTTLVERAASLEYKNVTVYSLSINAPSTSTAQLFPIVTKVSKVKYNGSYLGKAGETTVPIRGKGNFHYLNPIEISNGSIITLILEDADGTNLGKIDITISIGIVYNHGIQTVGISQHGEDIAEGDYTHIDSETHAKNYSLNYDSNQIDLTMPVDIRFLYYSERTDDGIIFDGTFYPDNGQEISVLSIPSMYAMNARIRAVMVVPKFRYVDITVTPSDIGNAMLVERKDLDSVTIQW